MAVFDEKNIVLGRCKIGKVDGKGAEIAALQSDAAARASQIVLTGDVSATLKVGDPIYLDNGKAGEDNQHEIAVATLVTVSTNTTVTLLHKISYAYKVTDSAKAYKATRTLWGLTRESGLRMPHDQELTEINSDGVAGPVKVIRKSVSRSITAEFQEITAEAMVDFHGLASSPVGSSPEQTLVVKYSKVMPSWVVMITGPWVDDNFFRYVCHAWLAETGEIERSESAEVCIPVTYREVPNVDTLEYGVFTFSATDME